MELTQLQAPLERLHKVARNEQKAFALDVRALALIADDDTGVNDALNAMRNKLVEYETLKMKIIQQCLQRMEDMMDESSEALLNRLLISHMLRRGWVKTARKLSEEYHLDSQVDIALFEHAHRVLKSLDGHDTSMALAWCNANRTRLDKQGSSLELRLYLREFVNRLIGRDFISALDIARKHLAPMFNSRPDVIKKHLALLALMGPNALPNDRINHGVIVKYIDLLNDSAYVDLKNTFIYDLFRLHSMKELSMLDLHLKAGLSALKTSKCGTQCMNDCPVCTQDVVELAAKLAPSSPAISCIVCRLSGQIINDTNPPMALPNGHVYSRVALLDMAKDNNGQVRCPETGETFLYSHCRSVFVL